MTASPVVEFEGVDYRYPNGRSRHLVTPVRRPGLQARHAADLKVRPTTERIELAPYPNGAPVIGGLTLSIGAGEVVVLVGRSGAGKSTILKLVNRLVLPDAGSVRVQGRDTREWDAIRLRRRTGYVLQEIGLFPHMTVEENVGLVPRLEGWPADRIRVRVRELLDLVGLPAGSFAARTPAELSGGQRQRVGVARALALDPPMLLMDEPFGALDPVTRVELQREFARIQRQLKTTVLLVTHDMAEAFALADRIGVVDAGALVVCDVPGRVARSGDARVKALLETIGTVPAGGAAS